MKKSSILIVLILIVFLATTFAYTREYLSKFYFEIALSAMQENKISDWAAIGDFTGGTLNTLLSFISIILIIFSIFQQSKSLELSIIELKNSVSAQEITASSTENQMNNFIKKSKSDEAEKILGYLYRDIESKLEKEYPNFQSKNRKDSLENQIKSIIIYKGDKIELRADFFKLHKRKYADLKDSIEYANLTINKISKEDLSLTHDYYKKKFDSFSEFIIDEN